MFDLSIENGTLVIPRSGLVKENIGISNGKIAALTSTAIKLDAVRKIDAEGKFVFPGVVEPHSHIGIGAGEHDLVTETKSALLGGVTTILFFLREPTPYDNAFSHIKSVGENLSYTDFGFHIVILMDDHLSAIPKYIHEWGITSFKLYTTYRGEDAVSTGFGGQVFKCPPLTDGFFLDVFQKIREFPNALAIAHCENIEIIDRIKSRLIAEKRDDMKAWATSRPAIAESETIRRMSYIAECTSARLNILHLTSKDGLNAAKEAKGRSKGVTIEVCHPYLVLDSTVDLGPEAKLRPPIRNLQDREALWQGILDGTIDTI